CFATYSGDLAPALLVLGAEVELISPAGRRTLALERLYTGYARHDRAAEGDGKHYLGLLPGELVAGVRVAGGAGLRSGYDKVRIRRSIEFPVAGVAVALGRDGDRLTRLSVAVTGTNPRPVRVAGTEALTGGMLGPAVFSGLEALMRDQLMAMKTTFTPGHY